jgi:predicted O-methyltransferase YrrM
MEEKKLVEDFWNEASCGEELYLKGFDKDSYINQSIIMYSLEPEILEFAEFPKFKGKRILEIGTALGGFTMFLKKVVDSFNLDTKILTFDISARPWYDDMKKMGIDVRVEDIFNDYQDIPNEIKNFIKQDGLTIILCDGGDKIREFKLLSHFLKKGDIIMAHDYAPNQEYFDNYINGKIWNWLEIQDKDINESCMKHNLTPFMEYELRDVVWVGKIKE